MTGTTFNKTCVSAVDKPADDMDIGSGLSEVMLAAWPVFAPSWLAGWEMAGGLSPLSLDSLLLGGLGRRPSWTLSVCRRLRWRPGHFEHAGGSGHELEPYPGFSTPQEAAYCLRTATCSHFLIIGQCWSLWRLDLQTPQLLKPGAGGLNSRSVAPIVGFLIGRLGSALGSLFSRFNIWSPNTGSFLMDACLFTKAAMSFSWGDLPLLTIS